MELAIAVSAVYLLQTMGKLLLFSTSLSRWLGSSEYVSFVAARLATACIFIILPTFIMGGVFPVVTRLFTRDFAALGRSLGDLYGANTIGCVIGSLAAGFVLLQLVGAQQAIALVAVVNGALGIACLLLSAEPRRLLVSAAATVLLGVGVGLAWRAPPAVVYSERVVATGSKLVLYREGPEASLAVLRTPLGDREINLNGTSTAYTDYSDIVAHKLLAHPPALLAENPRSALIIGFGMGSTAWSLAQYPLERIDCVELVAAERETADLFLPENGGILSDPRFQLIIGDGRNYLLTKPVKYDIISFNAIHPAFSPYLYTREFYELCRSRLTEGGVLCAWIPSNSTYFPSLLRTFQETFPHTSLWFANIGHLALIATPEPLRMDLARLRDRMSPAPLRSNLAETHLEHPLRLVSHCIMDEDAIRRYVADTGARINTDDLPYVEFDTTTDLKANAIANTTSLLPYFTSTEEVIDTSAVATARRAEVQQQAESYRESTRLGIESAIQAARGDLDGALRTLDEAAMTCPGDRGIQFMLAKLLADIRWTRPSPGGGAAWYSERAPEEIARVLEEQADGAGGEPGVPEQHLLPMRLALARMLFREGDVQGAATQLHRVLAADPHSEIGRRFLQELEDHRAG
jgi:spermidine synthase